MSDVMRNRLFEMGKLVVKPRGMDPEDPDGVGVPMKVTAYFNINK
jgi:hypothetical protein